MWMWHKPCRTFHPWCPCIKTRCLSTNFRSFVRDNHAGSVYQWMKQCLSNISTRTSSRVVLKHFEGIHDRESTLTGALSSKRAGNMDLDSSLFFAWTQCRINSGVASDLRHHVAQVTSLSCRAKGRVAQSKSEYTEDTSFALTRLESSDFNGYFPAGPACSKTQLHNFRLIRFMCPVLSGPRRH